MIINLLILAALVLAVLPMSRRSLRRGGGVEAMDGSVDAEDINGPECLGASRDAE